MVTINSSNWTLEERIGQLIVVRASGFLFDHQIRYPAWEADNQTLQNWLTNLNLGGVILLGGSGAELALRTAQLQNWASTPLLLAADIEEGVGQRFPGATWFPPPMALGSIAEKNLDLAKNYARQMGQTIAQEAVAVGLNWILAPIADVNNNADNPVINVRAFGETPGIVGALVQEFIAGTQSFPVLTSAKHFPGHGDTSTDSHLHLPVIPHTIDRLEQIELPPFQAAIAQGVDSVMTAHILVPAWDGKNPATLSPTILTGQLRQKLGFNGIIVTDALIMGGITDIASSGEVAIRALEAGVDILLMPPDPVPVITAIAEAVELGRLTEARIEQSLQRVLTAKQKLAPVPDPRNFTGSLQPQPARKLVDQILTTALETGGDLPLANLGDQPGKNLIVVDDLLAADFIDRACPALTLPIKGGYTAKILTPDLLEHYPLGQNPFLLQVFIRGNPFRGTAGLTSTTQALYRQCLTNPFLQGLIIYGSPYVLAWFQTQIAELCPFLPWVFSHGQMPQAQAIAVRKLFGWEELSNLRVKDGIFTN
ncbi:MULTISPECIES: glycoside hydrolase family 3 N-terminal domain-containing protein [unclassified Synechocystis]|uniref:glycoside hydrolase family 3 N-terminal domain-containing protein n=1 Tax=unclassified Synechocystis TaxID=2640012 RepID=UPI00041A13D5|nr:MULTISPECIES: glycoside hydrolase family 3 N-terminal domain-containing protein [unclassified Synechocystis]AIE75232.1 Beta-hexosaminidase [Synechocystis sp. PCC 6714]MCT0252980.1 beta-glucosidase [Synechocystis sp. CS-94]